MVTVYQMNKNGNGEHLSGEDKLKDTMPNSYVIVSATSITELVEGVSKIINREKMVPLGGMTVADNSYFVYVQTLYKPE